MRKVLLALMIAATSAWSLGLPTHVKGHRRRSGGRVQHVKPHYRSNPNRTRRDNYSTKGRRNPFTGKKGTRRPY
jgi:hypothetical protein